MAGVCSVQTLDRKDFHIQSYSLRNSMEVTNKTAQANLKNRQGWIELSEGLARDEDVLLQGGGPDNIEKQHAKGRLTARERIERLIDPGTEFLELSIFAAYGMYEE